MQRKESGIKPTAILQQFHHSLLAAPFPVCMHSPKEIGRSISARCALGDCLILTHRGKDDDLMRNAIGDQMVVMAEEMERPLQTDKAVSAIGKRGSGIG